MHEFYSKNFRATNLLYMCKFKGNTNYMQQISRNIILLHYMRLYCIIAQVTSIVFQNKAKINCRFKTRSLIVQLANHCYVVLNKEILFLLPPLDDFNV